MFLVWTDHQSDNYSVITIPDHVWSQEFLSFLQYRDEIYEIKGSYVFYTTDARVIKRLGRHQFVPHNQWLRPKDLEFASDNIKELCLC